MSEDFEGESEREMPEFIRSFLGGLGVPTPKPEVEETFLFELTDSEQDDRNCINAEISRLEKAFDRLAADKRALEARKELFWYNLRRAHQIQDVDKLKLVDGKVFELKRKEP